MGCAEVKRHHGRMALSLLLVVLAGCDRAPELAVGTLERDRLELVAESTDPIVEIPVTEGQYLQAGDLVLQQQETLRQEEVRRLAASLAQSEAYLEELRAGPREQEIAEARARLEGARGVAEEAGLEVARLRKLVADKLASQADLDAAQARLTSARADVAADEQKLALLLAGTRQEELRRAAARVVELQAALEVEQERLRRLAVRAPVAGVLDRLLFEAGERPAAGAAVAVMLEDEAPYARVHIPQAARPVIAVGTQLLVSVEGYQKRFEGEVRYVSADPEFSPYYALTERDRSRLMYLAEITLLAPAARELPTGLPVQVEVPVPGS